MAGCIWVAPATRSRSGTPLCRRGNRPCRCGNRGCLEVEADPSALLDAAGLSTTEPTLDAARAVIARRDVDPRARAATDLVTQRLAGGLACMVNILNPDRVVLGGMHAELLAAEEGPAAIRDQPAFIPGPGRADRAACCRIGCIGAGRRRRTRPAAPAGRSATADVMTSRPRPAEKSSAKQLEHTIDGSLAPDDFVAGDADRAAKQPQRKDYNRPANWRLTTLSQATSGWAETETLQRA